MNTALLVPAVITRSNRRTKHNQAEEKRIADHTRPRWWVHAHINTRATDKPGTLAATVADPTTRLDFSSYLEETRLMRMAWGPRPLAPKWRNEYGEVLTRKPAMLATMHGLNGVLIKEAPDATIAELAKATHYGQLCIASQMETNPRWDGWKTIKTWLGAGSTIIYFYGDTLDLLLVDHGHGQGMQAYKGYSILSR